MKQKTWLRRIYGGSNRPHHLRFNSFVAFWVALAAIAHPLALVAAIGCWSHERWASPDRDVEDDKTYSEPYWLPYGWAMKHRSFWSHGLIVGTAIRFVYGWWPMLFFLDTFPELIIAWIVGCLISDFAHLLLDL